MRYTNKHLQKVRNNPKLVEDRSIRYLINHMIHTNRQVRYAIKELEVHQNPEWALSFLKSICRIYPEEK